MRTRNARLDIRMTRRGLMGGGLGVLAAAGTGIAWPIRCRGKLYPGATVLGMNLGGLSRAAAAERIRERVAPFEAGAVTYRAGERSWTASLADLGVAVDLDATLEAAWRHGRDGGLIDRYATMLRVNERWMVAALVLDVDDDALRAYLEGIAAEIDRAPRDAQLIVEGDAPRIRKDRAGVRLDRERARTDTLAALRAATPSEVTLRTERLPVSVTAADLEPARDRILTLVGAPVEVVYTDRVWTIAEGDLAAALEVPADPVKDRPRLAPEAFAPTLEAIAAEVNASPRDAVVAWKGGLTVVEEGSDGVEVDLDALAKEVVRAAGRKRRTVELPLINRPAAVSADRLDDLRITKRIAVGSSSFAGSSEARATNLRVAAEHVSRTLVPPGAAFSFNDALGPITTAEGYVEGKIIAGDWYASDLGGGVCQVSTTVFRAALTAGFPFSEWHPHTFRLAFYELDGSPPGRDAAIYQPNTPDEWELDLVFANPTDAWLLLQMRIDGETLIAELFGAPTGYKVEIGQPRIGEPIPPPRPIERETDELPAGAREQIQVAQPGVEVVMTRRVVRDGTVVLEDTFVSPYQPQAEVYLVGTGSS